MTIFTNARLINPETLTDELGWLRVEGHVIAEHGTGTPAQRRGHRLSGQMSCAGDH